MIPPVWKKKDGRLEYRVPPIVRGDYPKNLGSIYFSTQESHKGYMIRASLVGVAERHKVSIQ